MHEAYLAQGFLGRPGATNHPHRPLKFSQPKSNGKQKMQAKSSEGENSNSESDDLDSRPPSRQGRRITPPHMQVPARFAPCHRGYRRINLQTFRDARAWRTSRPFEPTTRNNLVVVIAAFGATVGGAPPRPDLHRHGRHCAHRGRRR